MNILPAHKLWYVGIGRIKCAWIALQLDVSVPIKPTDSEQTLELGSSPALFNCRPIRITFLKPLWQPSCQLSDSSLVHPAVI